MNTRAKLQQLLTAALIAFAPISACTTVPTLPPIATTGQTIPGKIVWHDLLTHDTEMAKQFYGELFGWKFERVADGYDQITNGNRIIGGIARLDEAKQGSYWVPQMSVADVDRTSEKLRAAGGKILRDPFDIPGRGRVAVVADSQGAIFGMLHSKEGDPADRKSADEAPIGDWLWNEVWSDETSVSAAFYQGLMGYELASRALAGKTYTFLKSQGNPRVGLVQKPNAEIKNTWACYVRVADPAATAKRAIELGGKVLLAPRADIRHGTLAILADPTGAGILIQKWPVQ